MKLLPVDSAKARLLIAQLLKEGLLPTEEVDLNTLGNVPKFGGLIFPAGRTKADIQTAIDSIGSGLSRGIYVSQGDPWALEADLTIPNKAHLQLEAGALFSGSGGARTLTINGSFSAPKVKVFGSNLTVKFGPGFVGEIFPEWWGAKADSNGTSGNGTDCTAAIQAAINSSVSSTTQVPTVVLGPGVYRITDTLDCAMASAPQYWKALGAHLRGAGRTTTRLMVDADAATDGVSFSWPEQYGFGGSIRNLSIYGAGSNKMRDGLVVENFAEFEALNVDTNTVYRNGLRVNGTLLTEFRNCNFGESGNCGAVVGTDRPTNLAPYGSRGVEAWSNSHNVVAAPTITANAAADPLNGAVTATRVDFPAIAGDWQISELIKTLYPMVISGPSVQMTFSIYARAVTGTGTLYIFFSDSGGKYAPTAVACSLTTSWQRFSVTATLAADGYWSMTLGPDGAPYRGMPNTQAALSCYIACPQLEVAGSASAYAERSTLYTGTTTVFHNCHFATAAHQGCIVKHQQLDCDFYSCTFEGNGAGTDTTTGHGLEVLEGVVTVIAPYMEVNTGYDLKAGDPDGFGLQGARVAVTNPKTFGGWAFGPVGGGFYFGKVRASSFTGGQLPYNYPLKVSQYAELDIRAFPQKSVYIEGLGVPVDADTLAAIPVGELQVSASVGSESSHAREIACTIVDSRGTQIKVAREVEIESLAVTDGQGDLAAAGTPVGTLNRASNPATGSNAAHMTTTSDGTFSFKVTDTAAEVCMVRITANGAQPLVLKLTFAG